MELKSVEEKKEVKYPTLKTFCKIGAGAAIVAGVGSLLLPSLGVRTAGITRSGSMYARITGIKAACESFYTEYNRYPETLDELKGTGNLKINTRKIHFYTGQLDDEWTFVNDDNVNVLIDSDFDGKADKLMTGKELGDLSPKDAGIVVKENIPVVIYTNKSEEEGKVLTTMD